ncbi:MAG TPA: hypothetical protein VGM51_07405 [Armatimonadota bacterium]
MRMIALFGLLAGVGLPALAQAPAKSPVLPGNVSVHPVDGDVRETLRSMAKQSGARLLIGTEVTGKLTVTLNDISFEGALSVITQTAGLRWSRITVPTEKADSLTADHAADLVLAADTLKSAGVVQVQVAGPTVVTLANAAAAPAGSVSVYLVQTKADPAAIKAAREEARRKAADKDQTAREGAMARIMSPEARNDPGLVKAFTAVQSLQPDQIAVLMREFMTHSTPQQMQQIGEAIQRHRVPLDGSLPQ